MITVATAVQVTWAGIVKANVIFVQSLHAKMAVFVAAMKEAIPVTVKRASLASHVNSLQMTASPTHVVQIKTVDRICMV